MPRNQAAHHVEHFPRENDLPENGDAPPLWALENLVASQNRRQLLQLIIALERENTALRGQLRVDPMTKLFNRRALLEELERQWELWVRYGQIASLLLIDLNDFKLINDTYGHAVGDLALISAANHLRQHVRSCDWVARLGGDEFAVLMPESGIYEAQQVAEKLRAAELYFAVTKKSSDGISELKLDYSIGYSAVGPQIDSVQKWLEAADFQMYHDKHAIKM